MLRRLQKKIKQLKLKIHSSMQGNCAKGNKIGFVNFSSLCYWNHTWASGYQFVILNI